MYYPTNAYYSPVFSYSYPTDASLANGGYGYYQYANYSPYTPPTPLQMESLPRDTWRDIASPHNPSTNHGKSVTFKPLDSRPSPTPTKPLRVIDLDSPNPMTHSTIRYLGYINELAEAFHDPMKQALGKISPKRIGLADTAVKFSYDIVLGYMIADAFGTGLKTYYHHKEQGDSLEYSRAKGLQKGIGQALFQYVASYDLPARVIKHGINPLGKQLGETLIQKQLLDKPLHSGLIGSLQKMARVHKATMITYAGTGLSLASIPLLVKIIDPIAHHLVNLVWTGPTNRYIESRYPNK